MSQPAPSAGAQAEQWSPRLALLVAATFFMEFLDGSVLTTAIPSIAADFSVPSADVSITMTAYLVTVAMGIPLSGWLAERLGARRSSRRCGWSRIPRATGRGTWTGRGWALRR